ncbi:MAG: undecaprenyldiphospho-muramoylpentapeptide beta-N-acetylglucosaminyltransferase [Desulfobacteraceae bacterium]|nr:undecaprenyldiphospho-muramoylpentapeptide beta-N-acetylglucosaminyltransferase [Desulfobacteraceae bacterium]
MKIIIAGGKTGGHLFPGIAIAQALLRIDPRTGILFVGTGEEFETTTLNRYGFAHTGINVSGIKGKGVLGKLLALAKIPVSLFQALFIINRFKPDLVMGVGGYSSGPVVLAARLWGAMTAIQEQNSIPGITNRILSRFCHVVFTSFKTTRGLSHRAVTIHTGNPVRREEGRGAIASFRDPAPPEEGRGVTAPFRDPAPPEEGRGVTAPFRDPAPREEGRGVTAPFRDPAPREEGRGGTAPFKDPAPPEEGRGGTAPFKDPDRFNLLVTGGSQGAHSINLAVLGAVERLADPDAFSIVHQTGRNDEKEVADRYRAMGIKATARAFFDDMPGLMAGADLIISRAGAGSISEITAMGKPSLLIPYPYAADDHQRFNAKELADRGACRMILDKDLTPEGLQEIIELSINNPDKLRSMGGVAKDMSMPDADRAIAETCLAMAREQGI